MMLQTQFQAKLSFFRRYKHRHILKPQFNPIFRRMAFFDAITDADTVEILESSANELVNLIRNLAMGQFYASELEKLLKPPPGAYFGVIGTAEADARRREFLRERERKYRDQLPRNRQNVERLIVEMLDYQIRARVKGEKR
jgi:hypothetical protein